MHLTERILRQLLDGTLDPTEARALAAHLQSDCSVCEAALASEPAGALDGLVDRSLTALAASFPDEAGNDLEYARVQRRLRALRAGRAPKGRWARRLAIAASLAVVVGVTVKLAADRATHDARWDGVKGPAAESLPAVSVRLSAVAVLAAPGAEPRLWKVASGDSVPGDASIQLQVEVDRPADVAVARVGPGGDVDVFWHERVAEAGMVSLSIAGQPAAYPLAGLVGQQRWLAVACPESLPPDRVKATVQALAPPAHGGGGEPARRAISADLVELTIR